jgi:hypothetical protein
MVDVTKPIQVNQPAQKINFWIIILAVCIVSFFVILSIIVIFRVWENPTVCPQDCLGQTIEQKTTNPFCGNGVCETNESPNKLNTLFLGLIILLLIPTAIMILYFIIKGSKPEAKVSFIHTWNNAKYFPLDLKWINQACKENPESWGGKPRFKGLEGDPEQTKGGRTPREVDALWELQNHLTQKYDKIARIRHNMEVEPEESLIGLQIGHIGRDGILYNEMGRLKFLETMPVKPEYTQVIQQPASQTHATGEEEETEEIEIE